MPRLFYKIWDWISTPYSSRMGDKSIRLANVGLTGFAVVSAFVLFIVESDKKNKCSAQCDCRACAVRMDSLMEANRKIEIENRLLRLESLRLKEQLKPFQFPWLRDVGQAKKKNE